MGKMAVALRLDPAVVEWADEYAESRGVARQTVLEAAVASFMVDARAGVPELRRAAAEQSAVNTGSGQGYGQCPDRPEGLGHVWRSAKSDSERSCEFCGKPGRRNPQQHPGEGNFAEATRARSELFAGLRTPESVKAYGKRAKDAG